MFDQLILDRFWSKVDISGGRDQCWPWLASLNFKKGYGIFTINKKAFLATKIVMLIEHGHVPDGMYVCHKCDNPPCVNPNHLFFGTPKENAQDAVRKGRMKPFIGTGERNPRALLKEWQVREIKLSSEPNIDLARRYGVKSDVIYEIRRGRTWSHIK